MISSMALVAPLGIRLSSWSHLFRKNTTDTIGSTGETEEDTDDERDQHVLDQDSDAHADQGPERDRAHPE